MYQQVVDDVIVGVKQHFSDEGLDESVLADLQTLWMQKLKLHSTVVGHRGAGAAIKTEYVLPHPSSPCLVVVVTVSAGSVGDSRV